MNVWLFEWGPGAGALGVVVGCARHGLPLTTLSYYLIQQSNFYTKKIIETYCPDLILIADNLIEAINIRSEWGGAELSRAIFSLTIDGKKEFLSDKNNDNKNDQFTKTIKLYGSKNLEFDENDYSFLDKVLEIMKNTENIQSKQRKTAQKVVKNKNKNKKYNRI